MDVADAVTVFVCRKCRGANRTIEVLEAETDARVKVVGCQKICHDHVVGVRRDGELVWFEEVDSPPRRRALVRFVTAVGPAAVPKRLRRLIVRKRAGRLRT
jgi:hypothetical protein